MVNTWLDPSVGHEDWLITYDSVPGETGVRFGTTDSNDIDYRLQWPEIDVSITPGQTPNPSGSRNYVMTLSLRSVVMSGGGSYNRALLKEALLVPNRRLVVQKGIGLELVWQPNPGSGGVGQEQNDLNHELVGYGAKPLRVTIKPIGGFQGSFFLVWEVSAELRNCNFRMEDLEIYQKAVRHLVHSTEWSIDAAGLSRRIINGELAFESTSRDLIRVPTVGPTPSRVFHASEMRPRIVVPVPTGFRRLQQSFLESEDHNVLKFQFVDEELPGVAPPFGCIRADGRISAQTDYTKSGFQEAVYGIEVSYEIHPRFNIEVAMTNFFASLVSLMATLRFLPCKTPEDPDPETSPREDELPRFVIPMSVQISRGLYDSARLIQCAAQLLVVGCAGDLIVNPLSFSHSHFQSNWNAWAAGMQKLRTETLEPIVGAWGTYGVSGVENDIDKVDLHSCSRFDYNSYDNWDKAELINWYKVSLPNVSMSPYAISCTLKKDEGMWIYYDVSVTTETDNNVEVIKRATSPETLPTFSVASLSQDEGGAVPMVLGPRNDSGAYTLSPPTQYQQTIIEQSARASSTVYLQFVGVSIGKIKDLPVLRSADGQTLAQGKVVQHQESAGNYLGCPATLLKYTIPYEVPEGITKLKIVRNPIHGTNSGVANGII